MTDPFYGSTSAAMFDRLTVAESNERSPVKPSCPDDTTPTSAKSSPRSRTLPAPGIMILPMMLLLVHYSMVMMLLQLCDRRQTREVVECRIASDRPPSFSDRCF